MPMLIKTMKDARTICWRYHRKITISIIIFSALYFFVSITLTKTQDSSNENVQGSNIDTFQHQRNDGVEGKGGGAKEHRKNPSRKIHRLPHNALPAEGIKGLAKGAQRGQVGQKEEDFSSSSTSSSADGPGQKQSDAKANKPTKKFPQAIIIGVKKGGTRALLEFISLHPDVEAAVREMHFFDRNYDKGLEWYRDQMPLTKPGQITIEKTPGYYITEEAPQRIHDLAKDTKLIIVLRDPVVRAISDFAQSVATGRRKESEFSRLAVPDPKTGIVDGDWYAVMIGRYADHLDRWFKYFPRSQFLFINGDEMIKNPVPQLVKVQEFLKIDTIIDEQYFIFNSTKGFYCVKKTVEDEEVKCLGDSKGRAHPEISPSIIHSLRKFYEPHNKRFYSMIGENFHWGEEERR